MPKGSLSEVTNTRTANLGLQRLLAPLYRHTRSPRRARERGFAAGRHHASLSMRLVAQAAD
jgi:hypothetical protein